MTHEFEVEEPDSGGMSGWQKVVVALIVGVVGAGAVFVVQNAEPTEVRFLGAQGELPRWLMLGIAALSGAVVTKLVAVWRRR